jgi:hypothetical protein
MVKFNTFFKEIVKILAKFIKRIFLQRKMWLKHGYFNFALESILGENFAHIPWFGEPW